jgi:hypothetical protein
MSVGHQERLGRTIRRSGEQFQGAAAGGLLGFSLSTYGPGSPILEWVKWHSTDAIVWAVTGALVAGAVVYCYRAFSR